MPFVKRAKPTADEVIDGAERRVILAASNTVDSRVTIDRWYVPAGHHIALNVTKGAICWVEFNWTVALAFDIRLPDGRL